MKLLMAAYDPSRKGQNGYWSWMHPDLPAGLPSLFYEILSPEDKPSATAEIVILQKPENCRGGCLAIDDEWGCVYRFGYGGLDRSLRQSFVLLAGFAPRKDLGLGDWLTSLQAGHWLKFLDRGETGFLPPADCSLTLAEATSVPDPKQVRQARDTGRLFGAGEAGIRSVAGVASNELVGKNSFHCRIRQFPPSDLSAELSVEKKPWIKLPRFSAGSTPVEEIAYEPSNAMPEGRQVLQPPPIASGRPTATSWEPNDIHYRIDDDRRARIDPFKREIFARIKSIVAIAWAIAISIALILVGLMIYEWNRDMRRSRELAGEAKNGPMPRLSPPGTMSSPDGSSLTRNSARDPRSRSDDADANRTGTAPLDVEKSLKKMQEQIDALKKRVAQLEMEARTIWP